VIGRNWLTVYSHESTVAGCVIHLQFKLGDKMAVHIKDAVSIHVVQVCNVLVYRMVVNSKFT
jgi:hypothetical protein